MDTEEGGRVGVNSSERTQDDIQYMNMVVGHWRERVVMSVKKW